MENKRNEFLIIKIENFEKIEQSYKHFNSEIYFKLKRSLEHFGQIRPIICYNEEGKYKIVEGTKIFQALIELGNKSILCHVINKEDSFKVQMLLNELNFESNYIELSYLFKNIDIQKEKKDLPFSDEEINKMQSIYQYDWHKVMHKQINTNQTNLFEQ